MISSATPLLVSIGQASGMIVAIARPPDVYAAPPSGGPPPTYLLQRSSDLIAWTTVDTRIPSQVSRWISLFDQSPVFGARAYYQVTMLGEVSNNVYYSPVAAPPGATPGSLSPSALGSYPLLGSDVYVDPVIREAIIGPNGDLLAVNGLELLAQDLRTRLITSQGELLLHPAFGLPRQRIIGGGQADAIAQAQILQALIIGTLEQDPRVDHVQNVAINQVAMDAWIVAVSLVAIGAEDAGLTNIVFPYFI